MAVRRSFHSVHFVCAPRISALLPKRSVFGTALLLQAMPLVVQAHAYPSLHAPCRCSDLQQHLLVLLAAAIAIGGSGQPV